MKPCHAVKSFFPTYKDIKKLHFRSVLLPFSEAKLCVVHWCAFESRKFGKHDTECYFSHFGYARLLFLMGCGSRRHLPAPVGSSHIASVTMKVWFWRIESSKRVILHLQLLLNFEIIFIVYKCQILSLANFVKVQQFPLYLWHIFQINNPSYLIYSFMFLFSCQKTNSSGIEYCENPFLGYIGID